MKIKVTARDINNCNKPIINLGYCECHELLSAFSPDMYTCGMYGWNFDVYYLTDAVICTGFGRMPKRGQLDSHEREILRGYSKQISEEKEWFKRYEMSQELLPMAIAEILNYRAMARADDF